MKIGNLALAALITAASAHGAIVNAQFMPQTPRPGRPQTFDPALWKTGTLTIQNPLGFTIQQQKNGRWETIGSSRTITKTAKLLPGTTATFKLRIVDRNNPNKTLFNHSAGGFSSEMWNRAEYTASLGHQGFEETFQICVPGDRCRSGGSLRSVSTYSAEITIRPNPATTSVKLGHGMAFQGNTSTNAPESILCSRNPIGITYIPYFGGTIGGIRANGTSNNYLAEGTSNRALRQWCGRTFPGSAGFISRDLKLSDMIALTAGGASQFFTNSSVADMPGAPGAPSAPYWNKGSHYRAFIYDSNSKRSTLLGTFNASVREKLEETFSNNSKKLYVVRNIYPSNRNQYITIVDLSNAISGISRVTGTIRANTSGSQWTVRIGEETRTVDIGEITEEIDSDYKGLTIDNDNAPSMSISNARMTSARSNEFAIKFNVNVSGISGEVNNDGGADWDYTIRSGTVQMEIPFAIIKEGDKLKVNQLKNCARGECTKSVSGFNFDLPNVPDLVLRAFDVNKYKITGDVQKTISQNVGKSLQQSLEPLASQEFSVPSIENVPGISNPLEHFLGINSNLVPNIQVNASQKTISLRYQPKVPFITPAFMRNQIPQVNISYP